MITADAVMASGGAAIDDLRLVPPPDAPQQPMATSATTEHQAMLDCP